MKKIILFLFVVLGSSFHASAQYWGGGISPQVMNDPCVQAAIGVANSTAWVNNQCMQMQQAMQQSMQYYGVPAQQPSMNYSEPQSSSYEDRYGYKDYHICHGCGVCQTCNGKGWYTAFGNTVSCPNCSDGKCSTCGGSGQVYGLK